MTQIRSLKIDDVEKLSRFLMAGFGESEVEFASPEVLKWKYLDRTGHRNILAADGDRIVGFVGVESTPLVLGRSQKLVSAGQGMDWLAARSNIAIGLFMFQGSYEFSDVQFVIGGSSIAVEMRRKMGWQFPAEIPRFTKVLNPLHRLRRGRSDRFWKASLKLGRDYCRLLKPQPRPATQLQLSPTSQFGDEIEQIANACLMPHIHTQRTAQRLNEYLQYPAGKMTGWIMEDSHRIRGFGLLNISLRDGIRIGRIVDCFMDSLEPDLWHSAVYRLTGLLRQQGADIAMSFGGLDWMDRALLHSGYRLQARAPLTIHDPRHLLPRDATFFFTLLESDHGYL